MFQFYNILLIFSVLNSKSTLIFNTFNNSFLLEDLIFKLWNSDALINYRINKKNFR